MDKLTGWIKNTLFPEYLDFRARLFNMLAMAGIAVSLAVGIQSAIIGTGPPNRILCFTAAALAVFLLHYANRSGRFELCYMITIAVVFIGFFPVMFFTAGGYHSGMPSFFVMAVIFSVIMLEGKRLFAMAALEVVVYTGVCITAYRYPQTVHKLAGEREIFVDVLTGIILVSILLGIVLSKHFALYREQQRKLEEAREEALRLSEIKTNFLANMSHEIRSPINVILGMNERILRNSTMTDRRMEIFRYARSIESAGRMLLGLINNILDISKIETGKTELSVEPYQAAELIRELVVMGKEEAGRKGIAFLPEIGKDIPSELEGDYGMIKQIVFNFLSNAVKYTERGTVTLKINGRSLTGDQFLLRIAVSDTGIGIKEEDRKDLFTAFVRLGEAKRRHIEGTGLGLAIAKELTELMKGSIAVESAEGGGSVFVVELPQKIENISPLKVTLFSEMEANEITAAGSSFIAPAGRILAVDDSAENLDVLDTLLTGTMLHIERALSGRECIEKVKRNTWHLILMDYMMDELNGIETFRELKKLTAFSVPVIAITADAATGSGQKFLQEGFAACLTKPVLRRDLEQAVLEHLPAGIVLRKKTDTAHDEEGISKDDKQGFIKLLAPYGINFESGIFYLSGNVEQYKQFAEFFVERHAQGRTEAEKFFIQKDWTPLRMLAHSLKSRAENIGAADLYQSAERLERYCAEGKEAFIEKALPLLFLQWEEVKNGLAVFIGQPDNQGLLKKIHRTGQAVNTAEATEELLDHVRSMRLTGARKIIRKLLADTEGEQKILLERIQEKIREADYGEAERMVLAFQNGRR